MEPTATLDARRQMLASTIASDIADRGSFLIYGDRLSMFFNSDGADADEVASRVTEFARENGWSVVLREAGSVALFCKQ